MAEGGTEVRTGATARRTSPTPVNSPGPVDSPVLLLLCGIIWMSQHISVGYWSAKILSTERNSTFYGFYVPAWLLVLLLILCFAPTSGDISLALGWLALYRLQDLLLGTIGDAFALDSYTGSWQSKVAVAIINIAQIVIIFAIAFLIFTTSHAFSPPVPPSRFAHLYLSWSNLPPLGSGLIAETLRARVLVMIESASGVLLTVIALSRFLGKQE
ncbi:MAG: hypothetical protein ACHP9Z_12675 [Streptosporangiales bacterium]